MPRWAARITLELVARRVEQLQDITEADALAEGVEPARACSDPACDCGEWSAQRYRAGFAAAWDKINGKRAPWHQNPAVWVLTFKATS